MQTCSRSCYRGLGVGGWGCSPYERGGWAVWQPPLRNPVPQAFDRGMKVQDIFHACEG